MRRIISCRAHRSLEDHMQLNAGKLQVLTLAAVLVLISGGIAVYAQNPYAVQNSSAPGATVPAGSSHGDNSTSSMFEDRGTKTTFSTSMSSTSTLTSTSTSHTLCPTTTSEAGKLILPITSAGASSGAISFSNGKGCLASITAVGGIFNVQIVLRDAEPVTQYNVVLIANGTSYTLGNMVTGPGGDGRMQNQVLLKVGTYVVSIQVFDTSSNPGQSALVLQTGQGTIVSPPFPASGGGHDNQQGGQGGDEGDG